MSSAPFSMFGGYGGTVFDGVHFLVHSGWIIRDVSMVGVCDCVKECISFIM